MFLYDTCTAVNHAVYRMHTQRQEQQHTNNAEVSKSHTHVSLTTGVLEYIVENIRQRFKF